MITRKDQAPDPLAALSPEERSVVEAMRSAELGAEDARRLAGTAHALAVTNGLARDMLVGQLDGIVGATRKSGGSGAGERRAG